MSTMEFDDAPAMPSRGRKGRTIPPELVRAVEDSAQRRVPKAFTGTEEEVAEVRRMLDSLKRRSGWELRTSRQKLADGKVQLTFLAEKGNVTTSGNKNAGKSRTKS